MFRTAGKAPGGPFDHDPPGRGGDHARSGRLGSGLVEDEGPAQAFGFGLVAALHHKGGEAGGRDLVAVEEKGGDRVVARNADSHRRGRLEGAPAGTAPDDRQREKRRSGGRLQNPNTTRNCGRNSFAPSTANLLIQT